MFLVARASCPCRHGRAARATQSPISPQRRLVMISQKKLEANRRNAQKSTGPKTEEGKAKSSQNGLTHGLTSRKCPILPGENEEEYRELQDALTRDLRPRGAT